MKGGGRPAVEIVAGNDVVAGFEHGHDGVDGRHSTGEDLGGNTVFQRSQVGLQAVAGWIRYARVFVTLIFSNFFLNVSGGWVDGGGDRAGGGIGLLSHVDGTGCEARWFSGQEFSWVSFSAFSS